MLTEKPWKAEAILRLGARVVVCIFMGALLSSALGVFEQPLGGRMAVFLVVIAAAFALFAGALVILGRPWPVEALSRNSAILLICFYGGLILTWWVARWHANVVGLEHSALGVLIAVLGFQGAALVLVRWFLREHQVGWAEAFGLKIEKNRALLLGAAVAFLLLPIGWGLQSASALVLAHFQIQPHEQQTVQVLRATASSLNRLVLGLSAILIVPTSEEILFRGILYPWVKRNGFPRLAWWGTSLLFGVVHFNLVTFAPLTILALALIWLYEKTNNLLAPITAHTVFNAVNFMALFLSESLNRVSVKP